MREALTGTRRRGRVAFALLQLFLRQLASLETLSTGGELKQAAIALLSLLAGPGYLVALVTRIELTRRLLANRGRVPPLLLLWSEEWLVFTLSFSAVAVLAALQWRSFALRDRDYRILGALPIGRGTVLLAKLASVVVAVLVLHVAVNTLACTVLPLASPVGVLRMAGAMHLGLLVQTAFACLAVVALTGVITLLAPPALGRRLSLLVQLLVVLSATLVLVAQRDLSRVALQMADAAHPVNTFLPIAWFMSFYKHLLGAESPHLSAQVRLALGASAAVALVALPCCLLGYRDADTRTSPRRPFLPRLPALLRPRSPQARAVSFFVTRAAVRSETSALIVAGWLALGVAVTLAGFGGALLRGQVVLGPPTPATLSPAIVLCFFALVGLRLSASYPAHLEANWLFRLAETPGGADYAAGVRIAALRLTVAPLLALLFGPSVWVWGLGTAVLHTLFAAVLGLLTIDWLFLGYRKIPFTCSYQPGKANLRTTWPAHVAIALVYCSVLPELEAWALHRPVAFVAVLAAMLCASRVLRRREARRISQALTFDDEAPPFVAGLGL